MATKKGFLQPNPDPAADDPEMKDVNQRMAAFTNDFGQITEMLQDVQARLRELGEVLAEKAKQLQEEEAAAVEKYGEEIRGLAPFIEEGIDQAGIHYDPEAADAEAVKELAACHWLDVLERGLNEDNDHRNNIYGELLDWAVEQRDALEAAKKEMEDLPRIEARRVDSLSYPLDKPNNEVWNLISKSPDGQISMNIPTGNDKHPDAAIFYALDFERLDDVEISRSLSQYDKRAYIAAAALFNSCGDIVTPEQIYYAMGNSGKPGTDDLQKLNDSLTKMRSARLVMDNKAEAAAFKGFDRFTYDGALLPFERVSAYSRGQLTKTAIHFFREPPLISFARDRKQITAIDRALLESPLNKTEANLRLDDYLIDRIGRMKNGHSPAKLLYKTIFERCQITEKKQRQRAPEKIKRYLNHYKACGWIRDYQEEPDGIAVLL